jgi:ribonucleoside-diphosphate reductase alpha chain
MMTTYTYDDVRNASLSFFNNDQLAAEVFAGKYALKNMHGEYLELTPFDMHQRLAREFSRAEAKYANPLTYDSILGLFSSFDPLTGQRGMGDVIPQGSPMSAIGNTYQYQSLSNCFVVESPYDSYGGIMKTDQEQAQVMKRRGGVGFDISTIRPKGLLTANAARTTDGIGVFMERFSNTCREVAQGGRRGALMLTISVHHPEIRTFINIKRDKTKVTGANISIRLSDEFMNAVKEGTDVELRFPVEREEGVEPQIKETVKARDLWNEIIDAAHVCAEPGLLFWDTVTRRGPADAYAAFRSTSTNPCGEITLSPNDSCRLMLINLYRFVVNPFQDNAYFDFERFDWVTQRAQRLMDDLIDLEIEAVEKILEKIKNDPEPDDIKDVELKLWTKILAAAVNGRRTGLGITALGDSLAALNIRYGSDEAVTMTDRMYRGLAVSAYRSTVQMAKERGAFPAFDHAIEENHEFIRQIMAEDIQLAVDYAMYGRRNIALTTTAPAGSVSIVAQTTSGAEPVFRVKYTRRKKINPNDVDARVDSVDDMGDKWQHYTIYHPGFQKWMDVTGKTNVEESPYWRATSDDIDWVKKIDMQAAAQKWICHSISNTTNIPKDTTVEVVKDIYMRGWETGCKGVTIYRDGSRDGVLVSDAPKDEINIIETEAPRRPKTLDCDIHRANVKGESYLVIVGRLNDRPYEIFCGLSSHVEIPKKVKSGVLVKNGRNAEGVSTYNLQIPMGDEMLTFKDIVNSFDNPNYGAFTRTISLALRHGVPVKFLVEQLRKDKHSDMMSFNSVMARVLSKNYIPDGTKATQEKSCHGVLKDGSICGSTELNYQQGCVTCMSCGSSKCS